MGDTPMKMLGKEQHEERRRQQEFAMELADPALNKN
jgi:hypothetical protein